MFKLFRRIHIARNTIHLLVILFLLSQPLSNTQTALGQIAQPDIPDEITDTYTIFLPIVMRMVIPPQSYINLSIHKNGDMDSVFPGESLAYTINYANYGNTTASGVFIKDTIPENTIFDEVLSSPGWQQIETTQEYQLTLGNLSAGAEGTTTLVIEVSETFPAEENSITNSVIIDDDHIHGVDIELTNNTASETTTILNSFDLAITKDDQDKTVNPGETITYTINYSNVGIFDATGVVITDTIPPDTIFNPGESTPGWTQIGITNQYVYEVGALETQQSGEVILGLTIPATIPIGFESITNQVQIGDDGSHGEDTNLSNNTDEEPTPVSASPDLRLSISDGDVEVEPGEILIYSISYSNQGTQDAQNVKLLGILPSYATFEPDSSSPGWQIGEAGYTLEVGNLSVGATGEATYAVIISDPLLAGVDEISFSASISDDASSGTDLNPLDNSDIETTTIDAQPDLSVSKTASLSQIQPGQLITYTITYSNTGNQGATGVKLIEELPSQTLFEASSSSSGWFQITGTNQYELVIGGLSSQAQGYATFAVRLADTVSAGLDEIENQVSILDDGTNGAEPNLEDNLASLSTTVVATPDLVLSKTDGVDGIVPGGTIQYTLNYGNTGNQGATGVTLIETLPNYSTYNEISSTTGWQRIGTSNQYSFSVGSLAAGGTGSAIFAVTIDVPLTAGVELIQNSASIQDDGLNGTDSDVSNNQANETTPVVAAPELSLEMVDAPDPVSPGEGLVYGLTVANNGNKGATGVLITETLPSYTTFDPVHSNPDWTRISETDQYVLTIGELAVGASQTVYFAVLVDAIFSAGIDTLYNQASISDDGNNGIDPNLTNNLATQQTVLQAAPDLVLTKTDNDIYIAPGDAFGYTLAYTNVGNQDATGVQITETLPANTSFNSLLSSPGWQAGAEPGEYIFPIGSLAVGNNGQISFGVTVAELWPEEQSQIENNARITDDQANGTDINLVDNLAVETTTIHVGPDLSLSGATSLETIEPGETLIYTLTYANSDRSSATGVVISQTIPQNSTFIASSSTTGWTRVGITNEYLINLGDLVQGESVSVNLAIQVDTSVPAGIATLTSTAEIYDDGSQGPDPDPTNNFVELQTTLSAAPDLTVSQVDQPVTIEPDGSVIYQIQVQNIGNQDATGVVITDTPPENTTFDALQSSPGWTLSGDNYTFSLGELPVDSSETITFSLTLVNPVPAGLDSISNQVNVSDDGLNGADLNPNNNQSLEETPVAAEPDLSLTKTDQGIAAVPGETTVYGLTYGNIGNQDATGVVITDTLPAHTQFNVSASSAGWQQVGTSDQYRFSVGSLASGSNGQVNFAVSVQSPVPAGLSLLQNTAEIADDSSNGVEPDLINNLATKTTLLNAAPDLAVTKSDNDITTFAGGLIVYEITVSNTGTQDATGVVIREALPTFTTFNADDSDSGWIAASATRYEYELGELNAGSSASVIFAVRVSEYLNTSTTSILNTVYVADDGTNGADLNSTNNSFSETTPISQLPAAQPTPFATPTAVPTLAPTSVPGVQQPVVSVPATISANTTWTNGNVYLITGIATVNAGVTLTLEPGVVVKFQYSGTTRGKLVMNGVLNAIGTSSSPIIFTSIHDDSAGGDSNDNQNSTWASAGNWDSVTINNTASGSSLNYVQMRYGGGVDAILLSNGANVSIANSTIQWSANDGLRWINTASGAITGNLIHNNLRYGIALLSNSKPNITGNVIAHSRSYAVWMEGSSPANFSTNAAYGNGYNAIGVSGTLSSGTWTSNLVYVATANLTLESTGSLVLQPGTVVKFMPATTLIVRGALNANGSESAPIVFTSIKDDAFGGDTQQDGAATKPASGDWGTVYFADTSDDNISILNYVFLRYGGAGYNYGTGTATAGLVLDSAATPIQNSQIEFSNSYGLQLLNASSPAIDRTIMVDNLSHGVWLSAASSPDFTNCVFARNNGYAVYQSASSQASYAGNLAIGNKTDGIGVTGTLSANSTWGTNLTYVVEGTLTIAINTTLTVQPDAVVKFNSAAEMIVNGWLIAQGQDGHPVTFTSLKDDWIGGDTNGDGVATSAAAGDWKRIQFTATSGSSILEYVLLRYSGSDSLTGAIYLNGGTPGTINHLTIMGSLYRGLYCQDASPFIENSNFSANPIGIYNGTLGYLLIQNSNIYGNTSYGLYNANTSYTVSAVNNWWGQPSGPTHASNPGGTGDVVTDRVSFIPFATAAFLPLPDALPTPATPPNPTYAPITISTNTTWTLANSPYLLNNDVTVNAGIMLTIEPGVVIKFFAGKSLIVNGILNASGLSDQRIIFTSIKDDTVGGDSNFDGSATWPRPGDWGRILFASSVVDSQTRLVQSIVRYGGSNGAVQTDSASPTISDNQIVKNASYGIRAINTSAPKIQRNWVLDNLGGGILLESTSSPLIESNELWGNTGFAVYMDATCYPTFSGNIAQYNDRNGVRVAGTMSFNQTWYPNLTYVVDGLLTINAGAALTLQPGTVVKFLTSASGFVVNGAITADGASEANIYFTSLRDDTIGGDTDDDDGIFWPVPGDWASLAYNDSSSDSQNLLDYVQVRYAGSANVGVSITSAAPRITNSIFEKTKGNAINLASGSNPLIEANTIKESSQDGLYITGSSAPSVHNNLFTRNNRYAVYLTAESKPLFSSNQAIDNSYNGAAVSGTFAGSSTWVKDLTYIAIDNLTIPNGAALTVQPGVVIKFFAAKGMTVNGPLVVDGTDLDPAALTSIKDDTYGGDTNNDGSWSLPTSGNWGTISFSSTSAGSRILESAIRFGGNPAIKVDLASVMLSNNFIQYNTVGINLQTANQSPNTISENTFVDNFSYAIVTNLPNLYSIEADNSFVNNVGNSVYLETSTLTSDLTFYSGFVYRLNSLTVPIGSTLTLSSNSILKLSGGIININGNLVSQGTATNPVFITSVKDDSVGGDTNSDGNVTNPIPADWRYVKLGDNASAVFDYTFLRYGGSYSTTSYEYYPILYAPSNSSITLRDSEISFSRGQGISMNSSDGTFNANLSIERSTISNNLNYGIYMYAPDLGSNNLSLVDSVLSLNGRDGLIIYEAASLHVTGSTFSQNNGYALRLHSSDIELNQVYNNYANGNLNNAIYLFNNNLIGTSILNRDIPYLIYSGSSVSSGSQLQLQAGTIIKLQSGTINVDGNLVSQGTAINPVFITSYKDDSIGGDTNGDGNATNPSPADWRYVKLGDNASATFDHTILRYGGYYSTSSYEYYPILYAPSNSSITLRDSEISYSRGQGISMNSSDGAFNANLSIERSTISNNSSYGIYMYASDSGSNNLSLIDSVLSLNGSSGVIIYEAASLHVTGSTFSQNNGYALRLHSSDIELNQVYNNYANGNLNNAIYLFNNNLIGTSILNRDIPYLIYSGSSVSSGSQLQLQAGTIIKLQSGTINVDGNLVSQGTAINPVFITSYKDDSIGGDTNGDGNATNPSPADWRYVKLGDNASATFDHTILRYGGYYSTSSYEYYPILYAPSNSSITLRDSEISYSRGQGISMNSSDGAFNANLSIERSTISNNTRYGIYMYAVSPGVNYLTIRNSSIRNNSDGIRINRANASINDSDIFGNNSYGIYNYTSDPLFWVDARNNWWGDASGPYHPTLNPYGLGNQVSNYVDFIPWIGQTSTYGQSISWQSYVADPVNTATGNFAHQHTDLSIETRSLPLAFTRAYNSSVPLDGRLGYGWTHSYNINAVETSIDGTAIIHHGDGHEERFTWNGVSYDPPPGVFSQLEKVNGLFVLTFKDQTVYHFDLLGRLNDITDRNGNITSLTYTGTLLAMVSAPDGRDLIFSYDTDGRLSQVTDPLGRTIRLEYDLAGDLISVTDVTNATTTYSYDTNHRILTTTDANNHTFVQNTYNSEGRVIEQCDAAENLTKFFYDIANQRTTVTDPLSHVTIYQYDTNLRLISVTDALSQTESYLYDDDNNRTSITDYNGNTTSYTYDSNGNMLTTTDPLGYTQTFTYDSLNNLLTATDAKQQTSTNTYDIHSNRLTATNPLNQTTIYTYYTDTDRLGKLATVTDPRGAVTTYDYNAQGDLIRVTDALDGYVTSNYDLGGRQLSSTDARGFTRSYTYDASDRLLTETDPLGGKTTYTYDAVGNLVRVDAPLGRTTTYTYTVKDQLSATTDPGGYITTYTYDVVGNQISVQDGNLHMTYITYDAVNRLASTIDPLGHITTYAYDNNGNRTAVTDALGHTTTYTYDALNRQVQVSDALSHTTTTTYDAVGNVLSVIDPNSHTTSYTYNTANQLILVTDALNGIVEYAYDANGNRIQMTDANHHSTIYTYDLLNRLTKVTDPLGYHTNHTYDANSNRLTTIDPNGTSTTYGYDALNRVISILYTGGSSVSYAYDASNNRTSMTDSTGNTDYTYDGLNRPISITSPQGTINYTYDARNRLAITTSAGTITSAYDEADRLINVTDSASRVTSYTYDDANRQSGITYPNGVIATYAYDNANRLTDITYAKSVTLAQFSYTLDAAGNRLTMTDVDGITSYTYDALNRLTSVIYPTGAPALVSYTYDPMGNRLNMVKDGVTTSYTYNAGDRLTSSTTSGITTTFTWDSNGNLLTKGTQTFTWDHANRLIGLTSGTTTANYAYNGDGVRIGHTVNSATTIYLQDLASGLPVVLSETTAGVYTYYVYGNDLITVINSSGITSYYHGDGLGSTRLLTDSSGLITDQYSYDAFGETRAHSGTSAQPFTYTGEQVDPEAGLVYLRARYYDPLNGRFLSQDTWPIISYETQNIHRYTYTYNNPIRHVDPMGLCAEGYLTLNQIELDFGMKANDSLNRLLLSLKFANPMYRMLAKQLILEMAKNRPPNTSLLPYIKGRSTLRNIGEISGLITLIQNGADSINRARQGDIDSPEVLFGEIFALCANTINDIVTGPGRSLAKLIYGQEAVKNTPVVSQLDQKITGRQVVENIEAVFIYGPRRFFSTAWKLLTE